MTYARTLQENQTRKLNIRFIYEESTFKRFASSVVNSMLASFDWPYAMYLLQLQTDYKQQKVEINLHWSMCVCFFYKIKLHYCSQYQEDTARVQSKITIVPLQHYNNKLRDFNKSKICDTSSINLPCIKNMVDSVSISQFSQTKCSTQCLEGLFSMQKILNRVTTIPKLFLSVTYS